jgi:hypothetical protein
MTEPASDSARALRELVALLQVERLARGAGARDELAFLVVNDARRAVAFDQAALMIEGLGGTLVVNALTGVSRHAPDSPRVQNLNRLINRCIGALPAEEPGLVVREACADAADDWNVLAPANPLWVPLVAPAGKRIGGLWLTRDTPWRQAELMQLGFLSHAIAHAWEALAPRGIAPRDWLERLRARRYLPRVVLAVLLVLLFPVRQSAVAPAEIAARNPQLMSPPVEGVVESIAVQPHDAVRKGQLLFSLDPRLIRNRHEVAQKSLEVARADFARASQKAFSDPASKSELTVLKAVAEQRQAEVQYTAELLERIQVRAPADGVVAFSDASDWLGRPVRVGEKIMILADPQEVELVVWLPVDEAIALEPGAPIEAFLTTDPTRTFHATLRLASYTAEKSQEQVLSYRIRATFDEGTDSLPRIGLQATAKVYGERVTLFYYVFRRPIAVARRWLGL